MKSSTHFNFWNQLLSGNDYNNNLEGLVQLDFEEHLLMRGESSVTTEQVQDWLEADF